MKRLTSILSGLLIAGALGACTVHGTARGGYYGPSGVVYVEEAPPPPPRYHVVYRPGYVYVDGRYSWNGSRYIWNDGYYVRERPGYVYRPGTWQRRGRGHVYVEGRWDRGRSDNRDYRTDRRRVRDHR